MSTDILEELKAQVNRKERSIVQLKKKCNYLQRTIRKLKEKYEKDGACEWSESKFRGTFGQYESSKRGRIARNSKGINRDIEGSGKGEGSCQGEKEEGIKSE